MVAKGWLNQLSDAWFLRAADVEKRPKIQGVMYFNWTFWHHECCCFLQITLQEELDNDLDHNQGLMTTLAASTLLPESLEESTYMKVATIRSPYSFPVDEEGTQMSTRFITVTRTFTSTLTQTSNPLQILPSSPSASSDPIFRTETIPAPENILTSSEVLDSELVDPSTFFSGFIPIASSIETLPAVVLASSQAAFETPPLKTTTETFSTKELMLKTSVLPIIADGNTFFHTLTQSYYVTRLVEAVKTLPPMEAYEFIPTKAFTDFNNVLEEAGSEKKEHLLPGESPSTKHLSSINR